MYFQGLIYGCLYVQLSGRKTIHISYRTKNALFPTFYPKITSGEISAKETAEERIWAEQTPPAVLRAPDAPNYVFRENRLSNMREMQVGCEIDENLANDAKT